MAFGDVNLAEAQVGGKYAGDPGDGGWPTIRAYNTLTGYKGVFAGDWKESNGFDGAMCDVFGKEETMQAYVEEMAGIGAPGVFINGVLCTDFDSLCTGQESGKCSKQQLDYQAKFKDLPMPEVESRLKLLSASMKKSGKADAWMKQRIDILKLVKAMREAAEANDKEEL